MKPLNKNLAYDCSNLSDIEITELMNIMNTVLTPKQVFYNYTFKCWLHVTPTYGSHVTEFTDAKTLFK